MNNQRAILDLIKRHGECSAKQLADELKLTTMGVRQHLQLLEDEGSLAFEDRSRGRGRPTRFWHLTPKANKYFPDEHEGLTLQLIENVKQVFGGEGLDKLIDAREREMESVYKEALSSCTTLQSKLEALSQQRTREGYMAHICQQESGWLLVEDHCPICSAATHCQGFCRSELDLFNKLLSDCATVERSEHIVSGGNRCVYRVTPINGEFC